MYVFRSMEIGSVLRTYEGNSMYVCMLLRYRCKKGKALKVEKETVNGGLVLVIDSCVVYWIVRKIEGRVP